MYRNLTSALLFCALWLCAPLVASAVTMQWSPVGNPGNANDPATGNMFGGVAYNYQIGTYDVTNSQYVEFLNAKDPAGTNALFLWTSNMMLDTFGGMNYTAGNSVGSKYSAKSGSGEHPVNMLNWYSAIRFANWMNNGQGNGDTETGAYTLGPLGPGAEPINGNSITRNPGATVFLPSESEWYKAAYYNPGTNSYYLYPTSSNTTPTGSAPTALPNHANFNPDGPATLTDVGAYSGTTSPYGAFDMGGNVFQYNEAFFGDGLRGIRGGTFGLNEVRLRSTFQGTQLPTLGGGGTGFRVATVPEPSSLVLAALGLGGLAANGWRKRRLKMMDLS